MGLVYFTLLCGIEFWGSTFLTYLDPLCILQKSVRLISNIMSNTIHSVPLAYKFGLFLHDDLCS